MVNSSDMSTGVPGSRLVMDKPDRDDSFSNLSSSSLTRSSIMIPIKMLIAHEMSRETDSRSNAPSLVAKLMGLDTLPRQEPDSILMQKSQSQDYSHSGLPASYLELDDETNTQIPLELHNYLEGGEHKDVYGVFHRSNQQSCTWNNLPQKRRYYEDLKEKKKALVHEKFIEPKCLAKDENLHKSKRIQYALEVLGTSRELFLKFLQEPNSFISQHQFDMPSLPPSETKRITVLKPSNFLESSKLIRSQKNEKQKVVALDEDQKARFDNLTHPTRIVVLKPSIGKLQDIRAIVSPPSSSPRFLSSENFLGTPEDGDVEKTRKATLHRRDDTLLSSVFSNGYMGDDSSFHKSESEYVMGNLSDSEGMSPTSRHSWNYIHRVGGPFSSYSYSYASGSPESLVRREAKKRLSERWTMVASNRNCVDQPKHVRARSSTLGEMLTISDYKRSVIRVEGIAREQARASTSCICNDRNRLENVDTFPRELSRSRSVPVSSTLLGDTLNLNVGKSNTAKEVVTSKSIKASIKGKVSSFFSRSKRSSKEKASSFQSKGDIDRSSESTSDSATQGVGTKGKERSFHAIPSLGSNTFLQDSNVVEGNHEFVFPEAGLSVGKPVPQRNPKDNQDQPSPVSVLEQLYEDDDNRRSAPFNMKLYDHGENLPEHSLRSNLIDKSPCIGSISRTLSRDNLCLDKRTEYAFPPSSSSNGTLGGEQEWLSYVRSLVSTVGLRGVTEPAFCIAKWHSPDSPLDPSLRDKCIDLIEKGITHEGKRRQMRWTRKMVFDCVNTVLGDMTTNEPNGGVHERLELVDQVWAQMREWFSVDVCDDGDRNSLVIERVVKTEVVGKGWAVHMKVESEDIRKEIEGNLLEELVHEAVVELANRF